MLLAPSPSAWAAAPAPVLAAPGPGRIDARGLERATARALTQGGDARIELDGAGLNRYGCAPRPDAGLIGFGSSTASVISVPAFGAAMALHARLLGRPWRIGDETERLRHQLLASTGAAAVPGTVAVLAASGTDLHRIAALRADDGGRKPLQALMAQSAETGSGVAAVLADGCASSSPHGANLPPVQVPLRDTAGRPRHAEEIDADFERGVEEILRAGRRCLLVITDLSKTGLRAPSPDRVADWQRRFGERLAVLVDACQFRVARATVRRWLRQGWSVAVTGSKFITGPAFCGALLVPPAPSPAAARRRGAPVDGPGSWQMPTGAAPACHLGLLLRWQAALTELQRFTAVPAPCAADFLARFGAAVAARLAQDDAFEALAVPAIERFHDGGVTAWDESQTIFPFLVHRRGADGQRQPVASDGLAWMQRQMAVAQDGPHPAAALRFQVGQAVRCGERKGIALSALRISASARWVAEAAEQGHGVERAITLAMQAFDKLAWLAERPPTTGLAPWLQA